MNNIKFLPLGLLAIVCLMFGACEDPAPEGSATPATSSATSITATSASLQTTVTIVGTFTIQERGVCWSLKQGPTTNDAKINEGSGPGTFTSLLTGLSPNSTYFLRAYVIGSGKTTYGNEVSFKTLESINVALTTSPATSITVSAASSGGSIVLTGNGTITGKGVVWSKAQNPTIADSKTSNGTGTATFSSALTNLEANTMYYVRAYGIDNLGVTSYGNQISFTTLQAFTVTVQTAAITSIAATTAVSGGTITVAGTGTVAARGVCWSTATNPTIANTKTSNGSGTGTFTSNLTSLTADTQYYVRAYSTDSNNSTVYGTEVSFRTSVAATVLSLDGLWQTTGSTNVLRINGTSSTWEAPYIPNDVQQAAINQGFITLSTQWLKNITKIGTTWTCERHIVSYQPNPITITKADYINSTITMTSNGNSFTITGTIPAGAGWPSNLVGQVASNTYTRKP